MTQTHLMIFLLINSKHLTSVVKGDLKRQPRSVKQKTLHFVYKNNQIIDKELKLFYENLYTPEHDSFLNHFI